MKEKEITNSLSLFGILDIIFNMNTKTSNKKALSWLAIAHFVNDTYSGFLNPIMPFIADKIGFSMAIATVIMSIAQVCSSLIQPIFGFFADNITKRAFIFWGLLLASIFIPLAPTANNVTLLTIFIILGSTGGSLFHPQSLGFVIRFSKEDFAKNMGIFISAGSIGFSFGPIISAYVTQYLGINMVPYTSVVGLAIALLMFVAVPKISNTDKKTEYKEFSKTFKQIFQNKQITILTLLSMIKTLVINSCTILLPFLWKGMGYSPTYIGTALFMFIFAGGISSLISAKIERLIGAKNVILISMISTLPLIFLFVSTYKTHPTTALVTFVITGFVTMLATPIIMVMAQSTIPEYKSIIAGFINGFSWGVVAVFLTIVGYCAQSFGIAKVILIVSFVPVLGAYIVKYLPKKIDEMA